MVLVVPNVGIQRITEIALGQSSFQNLVLKLYANDINPNITVTADDFTEVSGGGYVSKPLEASKWNIIVAEGKAIATYPKTGFTFTDGIGIIYGYYIVNTSGDLLWAERFPGTPLNIRNNGDIIRVTPRISFT